MSFKQSLSFKFFINNKIMDNNVSILRNRKKDKLNVVRQLDAYPKLQEKYTEPTKVGGTLSIISRAIIVYLLYNEVMYYMDSRLIFKFRPDVDIDHKLKINIDLTVAMPCMVIGADILDSTNQNVFSFGILEEEDTWWELCPQQRSNFDYIQHLNSYLREEYHSVASLIFKEALHKGEQNYVFNLPQRSVRPNRPFDACRVHGKLTLNKVAGNFHITAGKSIHFPSGHIHLSSIFDDNKQNFSHRINRFSFGDQTAGIIHPLEGDEKILGDSTTMMQYFIEVVPTDVYSYLSHYKTFQYSVKENARPINHDKGSHGIPGLYFKYDVSALKIIVKQDREHLIQLLIRLCSIIAGIVVISGLINRLILFVLDTCVKKISPQTYAQLQQPTTNQENDKTVVHNKILSHVKIAPTNVIPIRLGIPDHTKFI